MPNSPPKLLPTGQASITFPDTSTHYELVRKNIPSWLQKTSATRVKALRTINLTIPDWHKSASATAHRSLKNDIKLYWNAQNTVDQALSHLQDIQAFAKPLLQKALKDRFGVEDDVEQTWLRLYAPVNTSWWVHDFASGVQSRTVSLLDAALHNFASTETFTADSEFITRPDARGHFAIKHLKQKITVDQFKSLCRELDIGARYEKHLNEFLRSTNTVASNVLRHKVILSQKSALSVAARMALMKKDIDQDAFDVVQGMLDDRRNLKWRGQPVSYYNLAMMDTHLTGIVLIAPDVLTATQPVPLIAYVPHDAEHPLKQYPSSLEFMAELTQQLRDVQSPASYQQYFSQFVNHPERGHFFAGLNDRLSKVKWQATAPGSNLPNWQATPVDNPNLQFSLSKIQDDRQTRFNGDLWGYFYRQKLNKIFNDTREIAISTEYADRMARWAWWDNLEKMLSDIFNIALLVAIPFVPGLGTLMLAYTAYQLTDEVVEGIVDLAEGRLAEAGEQTISVLESVVQLGAFAAAGAIGNVARAKLSPFFESLKPVQLPNGQMRLWNADLSSYEKKLALPTDARPDGQGIYQHQNQRILRLDGKHFEVREDPVTGQHRIQHPQRADAYAPTLRHNGEGAWVSETENPREWEGSTLMRRIGHTTDAFSDEQLEQIRQISGTDEAALRRMHVENAPPPPLLTDTLQRLGTGASTTAALSPEITLLFSDFPELPENIAQNILASASATEQRQIAQYNRLPLRLKNYARELQFEVSSVRAAQGLYHDALSNIDTERLALGALRLHTDMFGDVRIEIRQRTFDGELRDSAGPDDARKIRILIRDDAGKYQVRDASDQPIHEADVFFESLLHAMGKEGQNALGYKPGDAEFFRQWVIAKSAPPSERRTVLATPPIRPVAEHETMLLVRGGGLSREAVTLHERIRDLHPHFNESEVDAFANALTAQGEPQRAMDVQERDLDELNDIVATWENQQIEGWGPGTYAFRDDGGLHIAERLIECFERKTTGLGSRAEPDSYSLDLSREMLPLDLQHWWSQRPKLGRFLDKVTVLKLDNTRFSSEANGLLKDFPNLRELSAKGCELTRMPKSISAMRGLERLRLSDNQIVLDVADVEQLNRLTYLEILRLDENPLGRPVDIGHMPRLKVVGLRDTVIMTWPEGTFAKPRPRGFLLDLRDNPIGQIPEVVPGSPGASVVARTYLDVANLSDLDRLRYQTIRRSVGLSVEPRVLPSGETDPIIHANLSTDLWNEVPGWGSTRTNIWAEVKSEPGSEQFLSFLIDTRYFSDYRAGGEPRNQLMQRVWRMLDAVHLDANLREELFAAVEQPDNCADAGAQRFNNMGIKVLTSEASSYSTDPAQLERKLVTLAKGAARLDQVNEIAEADMASRGGDPDEVEVYLAYQTALAERLNLPWQSRGMLYREISGVTDAMVNQAYDTVLSLEEGDGLVNKMLERDFWERYLRDKYPVEFETNKRLYMRKYEQLETLRETQQQWLDSTQASEAERGALRERLRNLINDLPVPPTVVFADEPISDMNFERFLIDLGDEEKELLRRLTRDALRRAGL
ncbi:dermonecrotic toxin domain-containing protein [Pseudomonas sp. PD9R]|uniref:dermonecrotic toxin domain-containing protein n=1 Tax=Pseudomonas sp. PD9R TaxID=2853534 RepID=UPI001C46C2A5|nr:NEL-type E3 ubiquitin ligase domain-containing protein [Pseudomonas sp. PD9R]MBV6822357.1 hypothetical protein [Pseudomonas sp. PD9R]